MDLTEKKLDSALVYEGKFLKVHKDSVSLPDESTSFREYILHPGAVAVLALTNNGELIMERQYRYPAGREFIEIPAGKIDPNEPPEQTAKRELLEETGYLASKWTYLGTAHPCIGYSNEKISYYLAEELTLTKRQLDEGEFLEVLTVPLDEVTAMSLDGGVCDSKTIVGLYWLRAFVEGKLDGVSI